MSIIDTAERITNRKQTLPIIVNSWEMIEAQKVVVEASTDKKGNTIALLNVNDGQLTHEFDKNSRVSKSLASAHASVIAERFTGGNFFVVNEQLVDFRDNQYNGFVHSDESIQQLIDIIGINKINSRSAAIKHESTQGDLILSNVWGQSSLDVDGYKAGGQFDSVLRYKWSPFSQNIRGVFELVRLICANGMVGLTDFFNAKIPVINRWEEHMDIAYHQIQNKVQGTVRNRIIDMGTERATVSELMQISDHASNRVAKGVIGTVEERNRLMNIAAIADPTTHLQKFYKKAAFDDKAVANRLPGHMTTFDAWNMVTEMYSHTSATADSSDTALQRMANSLMFSDNLRAQRMANIGHKVKVVSSFSDPTTAFFGTMQ
jgi:hypothetical protein